MFECVCVFGREKIHCYAVMCIENCGKPYVVKVWVPSFLYKEVPFGHPFRSLFAPTFLDLFPFIIPFPLYCRFSVWKSLLLFHVWKTHFSLLLLFISTPCLMLEMQSICDSILLNSELWKCIQQVLVGLHMYEVLC